MADPIDVEVGLRIMLRRRMLGMSQLQLANRVGVTFQQIQKYERGRNRVSASRMQMIAAALQTAPIFFFESNPARHEETSMLSKISKDTVDLAGAFGKLSDPRARQTIISLVEGLAEMERVKAVGL